jgi:hypothetical protein
MGVAFEGWLDMNTLLITCLNLLYGIPTIRHANVTPETTESEVETGNSSGCCQAIE